MPVWLSAINLFPPAWNFDYIKTVEVDSVKPETVKYLSIFLRTLGRDLTLFQNFTVFEYHT